MNDTIINPKDRDGILKLVTVALCALELIIIVFTLLYQQDVMKRVETPLTEEMARIYIDHPEKLQPSERLALNTYGNAQNRQTYLLVKEEVQEVPFPWKAWVLTSVGVPIGLAFLVLLLTKAYMQVIEPGENETAETAGKWVASLNKLSQINIIWFMLISLIILFFVWYIPEIIKYTGGIAVNWLTRYWWVPTTIFFTAVFIIVLMIFLQYRLKVKAMDMEMEIAKFKYLQLEAKSELRIGESAGQPVRLIEGGEGE